MSRRKCQPFVHIYYCVYCVYDKIKTGSTLRHEEQQELPWRPIKATPPWHLLKRPTQPAPCTALYCVWHCCHLPLLFWTVSTIVISYLSFSIFFLYSFLAFYVVSSFECSVFLYCFVYCFSLRICLFPNFVQVYRRMSPGENPIAVNKYHIIIQCSPILEVYYLVFL